MFNYTVALSRDLEMKQRQNFKPHTSRSTLHPEAGRFPGNIPLSSSLSCLETHST